MNYNIFFTKYIKKSFQRSWMIVSEFFMKWRYWGGAYAIYSSAWWIAWYSPIPFRKMFWWGFRKKTNFLDDYIKNNYDDILRKYKDIASSISSDETLVVDYKIWFFWYQGLNSAPELVRKCYAEAVKYNGGAIVFLSKENIEEYIQMPDYIEEKLAAGIISKTHYSDLLRVALLAQYGGLWIDATSFTTEKIPDFIKTLNLYSIRKSGMPDIPLWANYRWCVYCLGTNAINYSLFCFLRDMWLAYWKKEEYLIDYLFTDYLIYYAYNNFKAVQNDIDNIPVNNVHYNSLYFLLNKPYDDFTYQGIKQWFYKLSWKSYFTKYTADGKITFYGNLIDGDS